LNQSESHADERSTVAFSHGTPLTRSGMSPGDEQGVPCAFALQPASTPKTVKVTHVMRNKLMNIPPGKIQSRPENFYMINTCFASAAKFITHLCGLLHKIAYVL
jgi:hypothetical protein